MTVAGADRRPDPVVTAAVTQLERGGSTRGLGLGPRQLRRRFGAAMGYGPAFYGRIARLDRFSRLVAVSPSGVPLAQLAAAAGYYDEAHLWRTASPSPAHPGPVPGGEDRMTVPSNSDPGGCCTLGRWRSFS
ncbi:MAG: helix-turn-helix domain-containing protein [Acidimicrobiales bacterium]